MAEDIAAGLPALASTINGLIGAWHEFGYETPPAPDPEGYYARIPPLGERSANAIKAGHEAIEVIDEMTRKLHRLREQLVSELRQDEDLRAAARRRKLEG